MHAKKLLTINTFSRLNANITSHHIIKERYNVKYKYFPFHGVSSLSFFPLKFPKPHVPTPSNSDRLFSYLVEAGSYQH